jgi:undecaprenyl-diphosphatase
VIYRRAAPFVLVAVAVVVADASAGLLKVLVGENRPTEPDPLVTIPHSHSFPSGHTSTAVAGAIVLSVLVPRAAPLFAVLAAGVAYSRLYVGAHFPLDVVGGAVVGAATALLLLAVVRRRSDRVLRPGR